MLMGLTGLLHKGPAVPSKPTVTNHALCNFLTAIVLKFRVDHLRLIPYHDILRFYFLTIGTALSIRSRNNLTDSART
jgi:hypothetical protein